MEYKIGLIGCGTVGQGFLEIIENKHEYIRDQFDFEPKVVAICDKIKGTILIPEGIKIKKLLELLDQGKKIDEYLEGEANQAEGMETLEIIEEYETDIWAELTYTNIETAEPATSYIKKPCAPESMWLLPTRDQRRSIIAN